jgi:superfamily II DNA or RNA helicase
MPAVLSDFKSFWGDSFSAAALRNGQDYRDQGRVVHCNALMSKGRIDVHAAVQGSQHRPYVVEVIITLGKRPRITGNCTCPVGINCKHAVAALAEALVREGGRLGAPEAEKKKERVESLVEVKPESMSYGNQLWFRQLASPLQEARAKWEKTIVYRLNLTRYSEIRVEIMQCVWLKSGRLGKPSPCRNQQLDGDSPLPAADLAILRELAGSQYKSDTYTLRGAFGAQMLRRMLATERCHWGTVRHDAPLREGPPRAGGPGWRMEADGKQKPIVMLQPEADVILPVDPPMYVDTQAGVCGLIETNRPVEFLRHWIGFNAIRPEESEAISRQAKSLGFPEPLVIPVVERRNVRPVPVLQLRHVQLAQSPSRWNGSNTEWALELDLARVAFDYAGHRVHAPIDFDESLQLFREGRVERIMRDSRREDRAFTLLYNHGMTDLGGFWDYSTPEELAEHLIMESPADWMRFMADTLPELRKKGWIVEIDSDFKYQFAAVEDWYSDAAGEGGNDWFSIELGILVDGRKINLLPLIGPALEELKRLDAAKLGDNVIALRLPDGRHAALPAQRIYDIARTIAELYDPSVLSDGVLKVSRLRAAELIDLPGAGQWKNAAELRELAMRVRSYSGISRVAPPAGLRATLRPYQTDGLSWLQFLREYSFGGILADDMGLGKTVQLLAHLLLEKESGRANLPSLVVAPTSLMANWRAEAERFAPGLRVHVSHGGERKEHFERLAEFDLIVTTYSLLPRDEEILRKHSFHLLVLDEAQYVKNPNTKWADVARSISSRHRLCMTGTPMENHLGELWSLMTFLSPGYLGAQQQFTRVYRTPIEKRGDHDRRASLAARVKPFILRRKKEEVALDLPPKTEILRTVELEGGQRDLYETIRIAMHERVRQEVERKGMNRSHIVILDALLKLRQVCCDPRLVKLERARRAAESCKLELLREILPSLRDEGRRILLFSQFTSMLDLIEPEVKKLAIPFVRLDGSTADRAAPVRGFQAGEVPLFLISLKAGGTGLNLTAADTVIHYDPWWNPAVEQQATDRAHRIGQDKPVFVYKLVTQGTVEEKIVAMQERKRELVAGLLGEGAQQNLQLSKEELDHLFDPLA